MRLLLAEDERDLSRAITRILVHNNYDVDAAYNGLEALEYIHNNNYDGVILDVMMPKMDGFEVARTIRAEGNHVPVLMLTAKAEVEDKVAGLDLGADDYLTKPFVTAELLARIRALTRRSGTVVNESYSFGNVKLNLNSFEMETEKGSVRLTSKEFKMMEYLIRNRDILLSTERIMENVWEFDSEAEINVVWVFISTLRKKLDQIGAVCTIKAVRGVGYKLDEIGEKHEHR